MKEGLNALTEREKAALRLLFRGHDAKSSAGELGLSVHTVHERLREARRKLGVSSSREAARLLGEAEQGGPHSLGDKQFGVAAQALHDSNGASPDRPAGAGPSLAWLGGGMLVMSLIIAAAVLAVALQGSGAPTPAVPSAPAGAGTVTPVGERPAREWLALLDAQRWEDSWRTAAPVFQSQTAAQWAATVEPIRTPLGAVSSRVLQGANRTTSLPGAPPGEYEVLQFRTDFAGKRGAVETVVLSHESGAWMVSGYFIR